MMRPMKLAGSELMFGNGSLAHLKTLNTKGKRAVIVTGGSSMEKSGILDKVCKYLKEASIKYKIFGGVESDPFFSTIKRGADIMDDFKPDIIIALGGGSAMDAAKCMWVYYEDKNIKTLEEILPPNKIPKLRKKAILVCIPSTSGTASEVSRSIVITDDKTHIKYGIGDMEMMPDIAICDPSVTLTMPKKITAETGMDALTHAIEASVSERRNHLSDILSNSAIKDIIKYLPLAYANGENIEYREKMLNASMIAGLAFTNVSLGIVHSMAHTLGSLYSVSHGLANAILLPYVMRFNLKSEYAKKIYDDLAKMVGENNLISKIESMNKQMSIPLSFSEIIKDKNIYMSNLQKMAQSAIKDGCTKTNPIIPTEKEMINLFIDVYS